MIRAPRRVLVVFSLAAVVGAGCSLCRGQNAASPGLPTPKSLSQLHAAFRESQRCVEERVIIRANLWNHSGAPPPPLVAGCDDMKGALGRQYEATKAAANAGDIDAQMCYLTQAAGDRESGFALSDAEIAEYQSLGPSYVEAAFKRGDWRVVALLGFQVVDWAGLFIGLEQWNDPTRGYKAHRLLLLGAGDVDLKATEDWLAAPRMPQSKDNWRLSAQQIRDSDAWAQETYDKYFSSGPRLLKEPRVCTDQDAAR